MTFVSLDHVDRRIATWMEKYGLFFLRVSLATIFIWFGALKPLGISPAEELASAPSTGFHPTNSCQFLGGGRSGLAFVC